MSAPDPARCLRSAATALRARRVMLDELPRIKRPDYRANARRTIVMHEQDARAFMREAILANRNRPA